MNPYLLKQYQLHPSMKKEDVLKLTYQATFGAEHLLSDISRAKPFLLDEFHQTESADIVLYEEISDEYSRLNIAAWKYQNKSPEDYFSLFVASVPEIKRTREDFILSAQENIETMKMFWTPEQMNELNALFLTMKENLQPIHHSLSYRTNEHPHYRIIQTKLIKMN